MRADGSIDGFAALLGKAGLELGAEEMADALWLAGHISSGVGEQVVEEEDIEEDAVEPTIREEYLDSELEDEGDEAQLPLSLPQKQEDAESGAVKPDGIPIKAPAAPALRIRLELTRALRPLRRRVPSPIRMEFDQAATIERIADQGIWSPVLSPALERWLDVALVIEESKSAPLWKETLAEFQMLLERQGTFRSVSSWRLRSDDMGELTLLSKQSNRPRSDRELLASTGRRLILVASDCTSVAWHRGTIYTWLETWGEQALTTVIQLLPERMWAQTGLAHGVPMWLSALEPGVPSARMMATAQMPLWDLFELDQEQVTVPVVPLETSPLKQWASVVTGARESRTVGFRFEKRELIPNEVEEQEQPELSAEDRVRLFRATASLTAQKLAGLMSAAPVSSSIVNLIRQTMLPEAEPIHVAEVYMSGLMYAPKEGEYDFAPNVRNRLLDALSITSTEQILNTVSDYIAKRLNLNTRSFEALLSFDFSDDAEANGILIPFTKVAEIVLRQMGQEYVAIVDKIRTQSNPEIMFVEKELSDWLPLLQTFTFREASLSFLEPTEDLEELTIDDNSEENLNALQEGEFKLSFNPKRLQKNENQAFLGSSIFGKGFIFSGTKSIAEMERLIEENSRNKEKIYPYASGKDVASGEIFTRPKYIINFKSDSETEAAKWPELMSIVRKTVLPERQQSTNSKLRKYWWQFANLRSSLYEEISKFERVLVTPRVSRHWALAFLPSDMVFADSLIIFKTDKYSGFAFLQSQMYEIWIRSLAFNLQGDLTYQPSKCFETFPFQENWQRNSHISKLGEKYYVKRNDLILQNNRGFTYLYNQFHSPYEIDVDTVQLRALHSDLDNAILDIYGWNDLDRTHGFTCNSVILQSILHYEYDLSLQRTIARKFSSSDDEFFLSAEKAVELTDMLGVRLPWRYGWRKKSREKILERLLSLNDAMYTEST